MADDNTPAAPDANLPAPEPIPPFDPQAAQSTQHIPAASHVPKSADATSVMPPVESPTSPIGVATVVAGSRVVIVVSRGATLVPPVTVVGMPHVIGLFQGDALSQLQRAGLSAQVYNQHSDQPRGEVIGQLPPYGQGTPVGSETVLLVSSGPTSARTVSVPLPDVVGLTEGEAVSRIQDEGLVPQVVRDFSANVPIGVVVEQLPNAHGIAEAPRNKPSLWWLWLLLVLAVIFAAGGGFFYWFNRTAVVPNVVGMPQAQAEKAITAAGFKLGSLGTTQTVSASDVGKVTSQSPAPNTQLKLIDQVDIVVSGGQKLLAIPDVTGKTQAEARSQLTSAGLQVSATQAYSATVPKDSVISQSPAAGQMVPSGTTVGLTISQGAQNVSVPGVLGQTRSQAVGTLQTAVLGSQLVVEHWFGGIKGTVVAQYPTAGQIVPQKTVVGVIISDGEPPSSLASPTVTVPQVVDLTQKKAQSTLSNLGLGSVIVRWNRTAKPTGQVVGQVPEVGQIVPRKTSVIIIVSSGK